MKNKFLGWVGMGCGAYHLVDRYGHVYAKYHNDEGEIYFCFINDEKKIITKTYYWGEASYIDISNMLEYIVSEATYAFDKEVDKHYNQVNLLQRSRIYHDTPWGFDGDEYFDSEGYKAWSHIWDFQLRVKNLRSLEELANLELPNLGELILTLCDEEGFLL